ncbi:hypothetical protein K450DRAFT_229704 [Umbelopsis ramanniana AG]|uniref:Uncharacterized protein n=1 Tax=Umbelopsis ramanniana AG TaxID=1314678 RepID=A0AAD5EES9_UMBRA|nr:uncharacterized protein K450DRAFT_229704 [Umbelopsis ramanniana AG]KAI8581884.1 hypothetical protein K450DRAFT_229704 [Umbelopsis ramanniana AG]
MMIRQHMGYMSKTFMQTGVDGLNPNYEIDSDWLAKIYKCCPYLTHLSLKGGKLSFNLFTERTFGLCEQLVSLNLLSARYMKTPYLSTLLRFPKLRELTIGIEYPGEDLLSLRNLLSTSSITLTTLAIRWYVPDPYPEDLTPLLLNCPNLERLALQWFGASPNINSIPSSVTDIQLLGGAITDCRQIIDALQHTSSLKRLSISKLPCSIEELESILRVNRHTLEALTFHDNSKLSLTESNLEVCKNLKCLELQHFDREKGGGKVGRIINKLFRDQLETLVGAYDEPCFWDSQWTNVKYLKVSMKPRHTTTKAGIQRLTTAFPNVEYMEIHYHDRGNITADEWRHTFSQFHGLKGIYLQNAEGNYESTFYNSQYYTSLKGAYTEWHDNAANTVNAHFCYPTCWLLDYHNLQ